MRICCAVSFISKINNRYCVCLTKKNMLYFYCRGDGLPLSTKHIHSLYGCSLNIWLLKGDSIDIHVNMCALFFLILAYELKCVSIGLKNIYFFIVLSIGKSMNRKNWVRAHTQTQNLINEEQEMVCLWFKCLKCFYKIFYPNFDNKFKLNETILWLHSASKMLA